MPLILETHFCDNTQESLPDTKNLMECQAALKGKTPIKPVHLDALNIDSMVSNVSPFISLSLCDYRLVLSASRFDLI